MESIIDSHIREIAREVAVEVLGASSSADPEMITLEDAAKYLGVGKTLVEELHRSREQTAFPSVQLGPRTIRVDKRRLPAWIMSGGMGVRA